MNEMLFSKKSEKSTVMCKGELHKSTTIKVVLSSSETE